LIVEDLGFALNLALFVVGLGRWVLKDCFVLAPGLTQLVAVFGGSAVEDYLVFALVSKLLAVDLGRSVVEPRFALALGLWSLDAGRGSSVAENCLVFAPVLREARRTFHLFALYQTLVPKYLSERRVEDYWDLVALRWSASFLLWGGDARLAGLGFGCFRESRLVALDALVGWYKSLSIYYLRLVDQSCRALRLRLEIFYPVVSGFEW
jgi:hypothetical protein